MWACVCVCVWLRQLEELASGGTSQLLERLGSGVWLGHLFVYMNIYLENNRGEGGSSTTASNTAYWRDTECVCVGLNTRKWSGVVALEVGRLSVWSQLLEGWILYTCTYFLYQTLILISHGREQDESVGGVYVCASAACACMCWSVGLAMYTSEHVLHTCVYVCAYWEYMLLVGPRGTRLWQPCSVDVRFGNFLTIRVEDGI